MSHPGTGAHSPDHTSTLLMLGVALIWGVNLSLMKAAVQEVSPQAFNAMRFPLGVAALALLLWKREGFPLPERHEWREVVLLGLAAHPVYQLCFLNGLHLTSASHTAILVSTTPIWVAFADRIFGHERLPPAAWLGIGISIIGVVVLVLARTPSGEGSTALGDALVLASSMLWTFYVIRSRRLLRYRSGLWVTAWALFAGAPVLIALGIPDALGTNWAGVSRQVWVGIGFAGFLALAVAYWWLAVAVARQGAARTAVYSNLIPVVALTVAWLALGERLSAGSWAGAALACVGVWMTTVSRGRR